EGVLDAGDRSAQCPIRVVQIRRPLQTGETLGRRCVVEIVRMKLTAQVAKAPLQLRLVDDETPRPPQEREVIAVPPERENPAALRAEMLVHRGAGAAIPAFECRDRLRRNGIRSHRALCRRQTEAGGGQFSPQAVAYTHCLPGSRPKGT